MCFTSLLEVCDLHIAPDYPIILKFTRDSTGGDVYDEVTIKLKYSWKDVPRIEKFIPHLNPAFYIEYKTTDLPSFPINRSEWQKVSSDKLKVGVPVKSEDGWKVLPVEFSDRKLMDMGFEPNLCYCLRLVNRNPNWVKLHMNFYGIIPLTNRLFRVDFKEGTTIGDVKKGLLDFLRDQEQDAKKIEGIKVQRFPDNLDPSDCHYWDSLDDDDKTLLECDVERETNGHCMCCMLY